MSKDFYKHRFTQNIKWQFIANGSQALLGGAYLLILGRSLGAEDFGIFSVITALVSVTCLACDLRLQDVVTKNFCNLENKILSTEDTKYIDEQKNLQIIDLFILEIISRLIPVVAVIIFYPYLAKITHIPYHDNNTLIVLTAGGFLLSKAGNGVSIGLLRVLGRTDLIALCISADWGMRLFVTIAVIFLSDQLSILQVLWVALVIGGGINVTQIFIAYCEFNKQVAQLSFKNWSLRLARKHLCENRRLILSNFGISMSDLMAKDLDIVIISSFVPPDKVGLYKMAKSFTQIIWRTIDPIYLAIMPEIQRLWITNEHLKLKSLLIKTSYRLILLSVLLITIAYGSAWGFSERILGADYTQIPSLMLLMSIWIIFCAPLIWGHPLAVAINKPEIAFIGGLLGSIVGIVLFSVLTPLMSLTGAALSWIATLVTLFAFTAIWSYFYFHKLSKI